MERNYFMIRAMYSKEENINIFLKENVAAVGWSKVDFSKYKDIESLKEKITDEYYSKNSQTTLRIKNRKLNRIQRFVSIEKDDYIIVPYLDKIYLAVAKGELVYNEKYYHLDLANHQKVEYLFISDKNFKTVPKCELSTKLQGRLNARSSIVTRLNDFKEEIEEIFEKENYCYSAAFSQKENESKECFKNQLLENITTGNTNLRAGGIGLEHLVKELLECEGYSAQILSKNKFSGDIADADIEAIKSDRFTQAKVLVQVKHHKGFSSEHGLNQLDAVKCYEKYEYDKLVFVTSAFISHNLKNKANSKSIVCMDGNDLVDWIFENIDKLSVVTKTKLRISNTPMIL